MDEEKIKIEINTSLAEAWGIDEESSGKEKPSAEWPHKLEYWGVANGWDLYRFSDGRVDRYAGFDPQVGVISGAIADMTLEELTEEFQGGDWLYQRSPLELDDEPAEGTDAPSHDDRKAAIDALADEALGKGADYAILRGYFLIATGGHIALLRPHGSRGEALVVGTGMEPTPIGFRKATPDRRICIALARNPPA